MRFIDGALNDSVTRSLFSDIPPPSTEQVQALLPSLRMVVSDRARVLADELGSMVSRKIRGAMDAITSSADPVSQAANSLIELIDRLLRTAFTEDEVLTWIAEHRPEDKSLTYINSKTVKPTKRAQALCFVHGGRPPHKPPPSRQTLDIMDMLADVLVSTRAMLQKLKHADTGEPENWSNWRS